MFVQLSRFVVLTTVAAVVGLLMTFGAIGTAAASSHVTDCQPTAPYNHCHEVDLTQVDYWQDTVHDPDWRTIDPSPHPDVDYRITIDVMELNGGVIPTATGQGHYHSFEDYIATKKALLGIDQLSDDDIIEVVIKGRTIKMNDSGGAVEATTGYIVHDALSDENGSIVIDNEDVTWDIIDQDRMQHWAQQQSSSSSVGTSSMLFPVTIFDAINETTLSAGDYTAQLWKSEILHTNADTLHGLSTSMGWTRKNGALCQLTWDPGLEVTVDCFAADMQVAYSYDIVGGNYWENEAGATDVLALELKLISGELSGNLPELPIEEGCGYGFVEFGFPLNDSATIPIPGTDVNDCWDW